MLDCSTLGDPLCLWRSLTGRVSVFAEPTAATRAAGCKGGEWVFVTHRLADADALIAAVQSRCSTGAALV